MARFPYLNKEDVAPEHRAHMRDINLTRLLFHNPEMARLSNEHAMYIRNRSKLDPRDDVGGVGRHGVIPPCSAPSFPLRRGGEGMVRWDIRCRLLTFTSVSSFPRKQESIHNAVPML